MGGNDEVGQEKITFSFGKNWENFVRLNFSEERVDIARRYLLDFMGLADLKDKYFLDIGSGSGIHSMAALKADTRRIVSIDVDPYSVATTKKIRELQGNPSNWEVVQGSVLDEKFISEIEAADIVYSWGVLHHTGDLWRAVKNAATLIREGGIFYIAVYEKTPDSDYWIAIKKLYNRSSRLTKRIMELGYVWKVFFRTLSPSKIKASIKYIRDYKKSRGMEFWTDVRDWLGGWPYESATLEEVCHFCEEELGLEKIKVKTGEANIEYLFKRR
ncbi:MAG: class I SAM-dependent methyltransferase [Candidatus Omnitrophota bacterium]|jgi:2-polyprenyl-6-hydroxyphenyl methylase/3-demethylubiquinone-9 3-methyltransferase